MGSVPRLGGNHAQNRGPTGILLIVGSYCKDEEPARIREADCRLRRRMPEGSALGGARSLLAENRAAPGSQPASQPASCWAVEAPDDYEEEDSDGEPRGKAEAAGGQEGVEEEREARRRRALCLAPEAGEEVQKVEQSIEEMLTRLDEFCSITDMIRSDTSQLLDEVIPLIKVKVLEMHNIYTKVDKLEAFVKMAGHHISFLEDQVLQAEKAHAIIPCTVQKVLGSLAIHSFKNRICCLLVVLCGKDHKLICSGWFCFAP
ncbi:breast carcinoma-amplified sequence 4 isoform X2 [Hemicordylus capensis]|uniref:breast carcinoma-amplified sequence 4 isoform X2 n=1 Tax=Hemicordylus capensis TaxID=884348 RepID=UPI002303AC4D|nr:breast carcinoma-amplified sequence 4 isoform X2 [Hemicordylus capensis]